MSEANLVLEQLFAKNTITLLDPQRDVQIRKVTLRTMKPVMDLIAKAFQDLRLTAETAPSVDLQDPSLILNLISKYYDDIIELTVLFTDLPKEELLDLPTDKSVLVIQAVVALNKDFFTTRVLPALRVFNLGGEAAS